MKITFVSTVSGQGSFGGGSVHFRQLSRALVKRGHEVAVFRDDAASDGHQTFPRSRIGALQAALWTDAFYCRVAAHHKRPGVLPRSLRMLRRIKRIPLAWEMNAPLGEVCISKGRAASEVGTLESAAREAARHVDVTFCVSGEMVRYARETIGLTNVIYAPNGADCQRFSPHVVPVRDPRIDPKLPAIFWMGAGHFPWEGDRIIVELARRLQAASVESQFIMAGDRRADLQNLPPNVVQLGRVPHEDIGRYVAVADVCLCVYDLTAYGDGGFYNSPVKLYEYMAAGKPIVATDVGEISRTLTHKVDGLLVGECLDQMQSAVVSLLRDPELRQRFGRAARQKAESFYNWDRVAEQTEQAIQVVLQGTR